jgi:predicted nuclease of predicted toxin-antitoxin system
LRCLVDECVPRGITYLLRDYGHDVFDPRDEALRGATDEHLLDLASQEQRIVISRDLGFNLSAVQRSSPAGLIIFRFPNEIPPATVVREFQAFLDGGGLEKAVGNIVVLVPGSARFRPFQKRA